MLIGYTKLFSSILASTVWQEDNATRLVWITLLAMADAKGMVHGTLPGLASFARVPVKACQRALERLSSPDPHSSSPADGGRRIKTVEGGWHLINHARYRAKMDQDERRDYLRQKQQEQRDKRMSRQHGVNNRQQSSTESTQPESETESETVQTDRSRALSVGPAARQLDHAERTNGEDAGRFCERFVELYAKHRNGAHYHVRPSLDWQRICDLLETWDAAHLEKLAVILLTTDDDWVARTDRGIGVFAGRASWCEDRLKAWESVHVPSPTQN